MSWSIDSMQTITMTRGDTPTFSVQCKYEDVSTGEIKDYEPTERDVFVFAVKKKNDNVPLFTKEVNKNTMEIKLKEEDTKGLDLGKYIWEVSLNTLYGSVGENGKYIPSDEDFHCTFIDSKKLVLTDEVY